MFGRNRHVMKSFFLAHALYIVSKSILVKKTNVIYSFINLIYLFYKYVCSKDKDVNIIKIVDNYD